MKVLVTGGGGFLGGAVSRQLLARGDQVVAYQRSAAPELENLGAEVVRGDLGNCDLLASAVAGCDAVIHTAGKAGPWGPYEEYFAVNVTGTENVIAACREHGIRYLVHTSSPSVAHGGGDIEGGDESLPYPNRLAAAYPATKALGEQRVLAANSDWLKTVVLRPHLIWGPGDPHLLPRLLERTAGGKALKLPGGDKLIDTVYVDNAAHAHLLALDCLANGGPCAGKVYFISNGEPKPQAEIIGALLKAASREVEIGTVSPALAKAAGVVFETIWKTLRLKSEPPITRWAAEQLSTAHWYDISAARRDLGYEPEISITEGLERLKAHLQT
jgi:nucleoside-diphosphate-sugar epimerase